MSPLRVAAPLTAITSLLTPTPGPAQDSVRLDPPVEDAAYPADGPYLTRAETEDRQLALNLRHWLSGLTDPPPESSSSAAPGEPTIDHTCLVLPGSWSDVTRSFAIDDDGRLAYVSEVEGGVWHQRAAVHPTGPFAYVAASVREGDPADHGLFVYAYGLDRESCELGPRLQSIAPSPDTASGWRRYYGLEMHPNGRFLYQTTEASREIRLYRVAEDGSLAFAEAYDVTGGGANLCDHARRLDQVNFTHHIVAYGIDPEDGGLTHVFTAETTTTGTGNHHGGVLATRGGRTFLYTFVNVFPGPEGFIEQYEIGGDYRLIPLDPRRVPAGVVDARHPVVIGRVPAAAADGTTQHEEFP